MVVKIPETKTERQRQIEKNNETRLRRARLWMLRAQAAIKYPAAKSLDDSAARFIFWWIAFEAAYFNKSNTGRDGMKSFIRKVISINEKKANKMTKVWKSTIRKLVTLPPTHNEFWAQGKNRTYNEWERKFKNENEKCETGAADEVLPIVFERLRVVRHQIFHGANSRHKSYGGLQVKCGAKLLAAFVPYFIETIQESIDKDHKKSWGKVPFPRQGTRAQKDLKPVWVKQEK